MLDYIYRNIRYPQKAHDLGIEETAVIRFGWSPTVPSPTSASYATPEREPASGRQSYPGHAEQRHALGARIAEGEARPRFFPPAGEV
jgi:hypothetical protein